MRTLLLLGFSLGLDSFRVSSSLGVLALAASCQARIVMSFALCDGLAPLLGLALGNSLVKLLDPWSAIVGSGIVGAYGLATLLRTLRTVTLKREPDRPLAPYVPIALSLDNLAAGVGLSAFNYSPFAAAAVLGITSGLMSLAGLYFGRLVAGWIPRKAELIGGTALVVLGLAGVLEQLRGS